MMMIVPLIMNANLRAQKGQESPEGRGYSTEPPAMKQLFDFPKMKSENGKLILTAKRKDWDRNEIKKQTVQYICPIFRFANKPSTGA